MEKRCTKCGEIKQVKQFPKRKGSQDGYDSHCKACYRAYQKSEKGKESKKRFRQSEKYKKSERQRAQTDKRKEYYKQYAQTDKHKEYQKRYNQSEAGKAAQKRFWQSEKGHQASKKRQAIRRTRETQAGGSYTQIEWFNLCKFYDFHCLRCNKKLPFKKLSPDHIKPVSKGGSSFIWNIQPLCKSCNSKKKDKEIDYRKTLPDWINRDGPVWQQDRLF